MTVLRPKPCKIRALIAECEYALAEGPHPERARLDAEALLLHIFRREGPERNRAWLISHWNSPTGHGTEFRALVNRRIAGEPMQYITGEAEFYGLPFAVTRDVLIPRPETEHLVEEVVRLAAEFAAPRIADIGTGSGAIAVALAKSLPAAHLTATDLSPQALAIARSNAERNQVEDRIEFLHGDLFAPVAGRQFEIIASNPPYVPLADLDTLSVEVREHEPHQALFAGDDGLAIYHRLIPAAHPHLVQGGWLVIEIGYGQQSAVESLLYASGYDQIHFLPDYQGIPRVARARRK